MMLILSMDFSYKRLTSYCTQIVFLHFCIVDLLQCVGKEYIFPTGLLMSCVGFSLSEVDGNMDVMVYFAIWSHGGGRWCLMEAGERY